MHEFKSRELTQAEIYEMNYPGTFDALEKNAAAIACMLVNNYGMKFFHEAEPKEVLRALAKASVFLACQIHMQVHQHEMSLFPEASETA